MDYKRSSKELGSRVRVVVCHSLTSGYMSACWRELAQRDGFDLFVVGFAPGGGDLVAFTSDIMVGIPSRLLSETERDDATLIAEVVADAKPDVLFISGWSHPPYRKLYFDSRLDSIPKVLMMDNPFRGDIRQWIGGFLLRRLLDRANVIFVPGERSAMLARYWRVPEKRIRKGVLSIDCQALAGFHEARACATNGWPKSFLFVGRYHPRKGVDILLEAYSRYRKKVSHPWPLRAAGMGPLKSKFACVDGVEDLGFLQPHEMPEVWLNSGAFVLASHYEPWGVANLEAAAAGLPILCTRACGSSVEVVPHLYNGVVVPSEDPAAFAQGLVWLHENYDRLPLYGQRSRELAAAYSAELWADRVSEIVDTVSQ